MVNRAIEVNIEHNPILATKLYLPKPSSSLVERTPLLERIDQSIYAKLTLLCAPAGFGKTTLLSQWLSRKEIPVAWVSLDKTDYDPFHFIRYIIAALQTVESNIGKVAVSSLQSSEKPPIELVLSSLVNEISTFPGELVLVLDDYHSIENDTIHDISEFLIEHSPPQMQFVVATRVDPPLPLARLRVKNELAEFRISDLCFSKNDVFSFLNGIMNLDLSDDEIAVMVSRTEGWAAGLKLAALSLQGCDDIPSFIEAFAGNNRHIVDYLAEEVFNQQPPHIQRFLLQTAILERMSGELCDFITRRTDSRKILVDLDKGNLFIIPLDDKRCWYRYHHLFADLLRQRLYQTENESALELHTRASHWYEKNGFIDEAIDHVLLANDYDRAAKLIGTFSEIAWEYERKTRLFQWFEVLPAEYIQNKPDLCFFHAWVLFENGQCKAAEKCLQVVEKLIDSATVTTGGENNQTLPIDTKELHGKIMAVRALIATGQGDAQNIIKFAKQAVEYLPEGISTWRAGAFFSLGTAHTIRGDLFTATDAFSLAKKESQAAGNMHMYFRACFWLAARLKYGGQLHKAIELCQDLLKIVREKGLEKSLAGGAVFLMWGDLVYELNQLDDAYRYINKDIAIMGQGHDVAHMGWSYYCMMRTLTGRNDISGAEKFVDRMERLQSSFDLPYWVTHLTESWKVRLWLYKGDHEKVAGWLKENEYTPDGAISTALRELGYIILARYLITQNQMKTAISLLDRILNDQERGGRVLLQIETLLVKALALKNEGNHVKAMAAIHKAVILGEPSGYIRVFLDEGPIVCQLLEKALGEKSDLPRAYLKKVLAEFRLGKLMYSEDGPVERLSAREMEVLTLIAAGFSNKKIVEELFVSLSTVKTHLRNIYTKFGVHSRTEAIAKAKNLGLL